MKDKPGWAQALVGLLSLILIVGGGWLAIKTSQAETQVKIVQLQEKVNKGADYDAFLQAQVDRNEERLIIAETTLKFLRENSEETNENIKLLVKEVQNLNINMAKYRAKLED